MIRVGRVWRDATLCWACMGRFDVVNRAARWIIRFLVYISFGSPALRTLARRPLRRGKCVSRHDRRCIPLYRLSLLVATSCMSYGTPGVILTSAIRRAFRIAEWQRRADVAQRQPRPCLSASLISNPTLHHFASLSSSPRFQTQCFIASSRTLQATTPASTWCTSPAFRPERVHPRSRSHSPRTRRNLKCQSSTIHSRHIGQNHLIPPSPSPLCTSHTSHASSAIVPRPYLTGWTAR
jgi:hypothetical protein